MGHGIAGATIGCKAEKVPRPVLKKVQSEDKFLHFSRQWVRCKRASNLGNEMKTLAIVAQNHLVNIVRVGSLVEDRDEPIRLGRTWRGLRAWLLCVS